MKDGGKLTPRDWGLEGEQWIALGSIGGIVKGDSVKMQEGDVAIGNRGVHNTPDGKQVAVKLDDGKANDQAGELGDARLLGPLRYDSRGKRWRNFDAAVRELSQEDLADFPLEGERSTAWLCNYIHVASWRHIRRATHQVAARAKDRPRQRGGAHS